MGEVTSYTKEKIDELVAAAAGVQGVSREELDQAISQLVNASPLVLDTLREIAEAIGNDPNFSSNIMGVIGTKIPLAEKGQANGVATLDSSTTIPTGQLPLITAALVGPDVATQEEINAKADLVSGKVPKAQIPTISADMVAADVATQEEINAKADLISGRVSNEQSSTVLMRVVAHGTNGNAARPAGGSEIIVHWIGTATPINASENDLWTNA